MMSYTVKRIFLGIVKRVYLTIVPARVRKSSIVGRLKARMPFMHDMSYDAHYYEGTVEAAAVRSAGAIADSIVESFHPAKVVDVGCGTGAVLAALRDRNCTVFGLEYSSAALDYCRKRKLDVAKFDLENDSLKNGRRFDVAVSLEVAEHLPQSVADRYVDLLTSLSDSVVFTAAQPGQGGMDHVNEQPASYWISKFQQRGFLHSEELTRNWRADWKSGGTVQPWYYANLMIFRKTQQ